MQGRDGTQVATASQPSLCRHICPWGQSRDVEHRPAWGCGVGRGGAMIWPSGCGTCGVGAGRVVCALGRPAGWGACGEVSHGPRWT